MNGPDRLLAEHGWGPVPAMGVSRSADAYRAFIQGSKAEFGVAKHAYVAHRSGWFSDRTECYLAAGRPALVQDTGWSAHLPAGAGLLAFSTMEEAIEGLARLEADYASHARAAADVARDHFEASRVLSAAAREGGGVTAAATPAPALRIALVGPVAQSIPPARSGSIETVTAMLADGLVARGHEVTLFATASSTTRARLHAIFEDGYNHDTDLWPWELCELLNLAAAVERAPRVRPDPLPGRVCPALAGVDPDIADPGRADACTTRLPPAEAALWSRYPEAPFVAVSHAQAESA